MVSSSKRASLNSPRSGHEIKRHPAKTLAVFRLLLKYVSREEIDLLGRGSGGVPDVRAAIGAYDEVSPLYGFLQYRRRKVLLRYVPEGLSRLIQGISPLGAAATSSLECC